MITTWEKYFYRELFKSIFLFLLIFYGLYCLIDYASHLSGAHYHHSKLGVGELIVHYLCEFSARAEILIPFALLIGTIHTLCKLNVHSELVALLAGGFSVHRLMRPYIILGLLGVSLLYLNNEFFLPPAMKRLSRLDEKYLHQKKALNKDRAHHLTLLDGTHLIYGDFDASQERLLDVYWIPSFEQVWHMAELDPFKESPMGYTVDHFKKEKGVFAHASSTAQEKFSSMRFNKKTLSETLLSPDHVPLSKLIAEAPKESAALENEKSASALTALYRKLTLPWLALLAILGPAPFCMRFSRQLPVFLLFTTGIFALVAFYLLIDATTVLGERQLISPALAIFVPSSFFAALFLYRFMKMRT